MRRRRSALAPLRAVLEERAEKVVLASATEQKLLLTRSSWVPIGSGGCGMSSAGFAVLLVLVLLMEVEVVGSGPVGIVWDVLGSDSVRGTGGATWTRYGAAIAGAGAGGGGGGAGRLASRSAVSSTTLSRRMNRPTKPMTVSPSPEVADSQQLDRRRTYSIARRLCELGRREKSYCQNASAV